MELVRCKKCLIPTTRPDTEFVNGICSACIKHDEMLKVDWAARKEELRELVNRLWMGNEFDCVVASSGGKDSHMQVIALLAMGFKPLIVTATTCMLTPMGRANIDNLKRFAPTIEVTPNQDVRAKLNYIGLTTVGDISWPEHVAIFSVPMRIACALGIPLVFYGENPQATYGGPVDEQDARQMTRRWVSEFGGFLGLRPADVVVDSSITSDDMQEYAFPSDELLKQSQCEVHFLGQYLGPWDGFKNGELAIRNGMKFGSPFNGNWWKAENLDNAMTGIHDYFMLRKYGLSRCCSQLSVDIRWGRIARADAKAILKIREMYFPWEYAGVKFEEVLAKIGMGQAEFDATVEKFSNTFEGEECWPTA